MLRLLSDEDIPEAVVVGLKNRCPGLDVVRVQEVGLMHTPDPVILEWAASQGRQIITRDRNTMTAHAWVRVEQGLVMTGLFVIPERMSPGEVIAELELVALASQPDEWLDRVEYLPLR